MTSSRYIAVAEESAFKTKSTETYKWMPVITADLQPNNNKIFIEETEQRLATEDVMGAFIGEGTVLINVRADNIGWFLKWLCGSVSSAIQNSGPFYKHTFTMADEIVSFTLEDYRGLADSRWIYGAMMRSINFESPARGVLTAELGILYADEQIDTKGTPGTVPAVRPFVFHDGAVEWGGSSLANVEALRLNYGNILPDDTHEHNSRLLPEIIVEGAEIGGEMDVKFKTWALRQNFYGAQEAGPVEPDNPQEETRTFGLINTFTGAPTGDAVVPNYLLVMTFPTCAPTENPSGTDRRVRLTQRLGFNVLHNTGIKFELYNEVASYPDAS